MELKNVSQEETLDYENWVILEGVVVSSPIKIVGDDNRIYYNFKIDNDKFKMNCTITMFEENREKDDEIFSTIRDREVVKVCGKLFLKNKDGKMWVQVNVKNWTENDGIKKIVHKI